MGGWYTGDDIDASDASNASDASDALGGLLADLRDELVQPVPSTVAAQHVEAMLAARPVPRRRHEPGALRRRAAALVACVAATFTYGGLAAAGALPAAVDVPHHVRALFGGDRYPHVRRSPSTGAAVPGNAREHALPTPADPRRAGVPPATSHTPSGGAHHPSDAASDATTTSTVATHDHGSPAGADTGNATPGATAPGPAGTTPGASTGDGNRGSGANANGNAPDAAPGQSVTTPPEGAAAPGHDGSAPGLSVAPGQEHADDSSPRSSAGAQAMHTTKGGEGA